LATGASGLVLDCRIEDGNPADATLAVEMVERQHDIFNRVPRQVAFDGGFASKANLAHLKELGVQDVMFSKKRGLQVEDMARSQGVYRGLRRFRAGIEAGISFLKRCFGLDRCTWRGLASFKAYTWASIVSANLLMLARHALH
jgi:IS5 family transposase